MLNVQDILEAEARAVRAIPADNPFEPAPNGACDGQG